MWSLIAGKFYKTSGSCIIVLLCSSNHYHFQSNPARAIKSIINKSRVLHQWTTVNQCGVCFYWLLRTNSTHTMRIQSWPFCVVGLWPWRYRVPVFMRSFFKHNDLCSYLNAIFDCVTMTTVPGLEKWKAMKRKKKKKRNWNVFICPIGNLDVCGLFSPRRTGWCKGAGVGADGKCSRTDRLIKSKLKQGKENPRLKSTGKCSQDLTWSIRKQRNSRKPW